MARAASLAAAQTIPVRGDVDANLEQHLLLARVAAEEGAKLLVFPELSLCGYELDLAEKLSFSQDDARLAPLADAAAAHAMTLVVGAPVRLGSGLHLGALIVSRDRAVEVYTKHHLGAFSPSDHPDGVVPPAEATVFRPGAHDPLIRVGQRAAAVAICADTGRPSHPEAAARRGASIYLASMFVIPSDLAKDVRNLETYAVRHAMAVVFANFGGPSGGLPSGGSSAIWSERGERLAALGASGAGVVVAHEDEGGWRGRAIAVRGS